MSHNLVNVLDAGSDPELQRVLVSLPDLQTLETFLRPLQDGVKKAEKRFGELYNTFKHVWGNGNGDLS